MPSALAAIQGARQTRSQATVFIALNAIRVLSLVSLILVFASSIVVLASDVRAIHRSSSAAASTSNTTDSALFDCDYIEGSTVPREAGGDVWAVVNRLIIIIEVIVLFLSEVGWPEVFFVRFFPVLGPDFGIGALGVFEILIGASVLSHHVAEFAVVSAFLLFSVGWLSVFAGLWLREKSRPRRALSPSTFAPELPTVHSAASSFVEKHATGGTAAHVPDTWRTLGFAKPDGAPPALKGFLISKPIARPAEALPRYSGGTAASPYMSGGHAI